MVDKDYNSITKLKEKYPNEESPKHHSQPRPQ